MSILFITSSRLGDAVLSTGVLDHACRQFPTSLVTIACGPLVAPLFEDWPALEQVIQLPRKPFLAHWLNLWQQIKGKRWTWVLDVRGSGIGYVLKAAKSSAWRSVPFGGHRIEQLRKAFKFSTPPIPTLYISETRRKRIVSLLPTSGSLIAVAPAANWKGKEWALQNYVELLERLTQSQALFPQAMIAVFGAPNEQEKLQPLIEALPPDRVFNFIGKLHLLDIYAFFLKCSLFIGNDSGLMHLAAASGLPTLGLFGPSPEALYAPFGPHTSYIRTPESYGNLTKKFKATGNHDLMSTLTVDSVEAHIHAWWNPSFRKPL